MPDDNQYRCKRCNSPISLGDVIEYNKCVEWNGRLVVPKLCTGCALERCDNLADDETSVDLYDGIQGEITIGPELKFVTGISRSNDAGSDEKREHAIELYEAMAWVRWINERLCDIDGFSGCSLVGIEFVPYDDRDEFRVKFLDEIIFDTMEMDGAFNRDKATELVYDELQDVAGNLILQKKAFWKAMTENRKCGVEIQKKLKRSQVNMPNVVTNRTQYDQACFMLVEAECGVAGYEDNLLDILTKNQNPGCGGDGSIDEKRWNEIANRMRRLGLWR